MVGRGDGCVVEVTESRFVKTLNKKIELTNKFIYNIILLFVFIRSCVRRGE